MIVKDVGMYAIPRDADKYTQPRNRGTYVIPRESFLLERRSSKRNVACPI